MLRTGWVAALLLAWAGPARGDEVVLVGGGRLRCEVVRVADDHVEVRLPHGTMVLPRARVVEIHREARADYLKREARSDLRAGTAEGAAELYERVLAEDPDDSEARAGLVAALLRRAGDLSASFRFDEARRALARLRSLEPEHAAAANLAARIDAEERANAHLEALGCAALLRGDAAAALAILDRWRLRRPGADPSVAEALGAAHGLAARQALRAGALREALDHCRAAATYGFRDVERDLFLLQPVAVLEALKEGEPGEARRLLDRIASSYPDPAVPAFLRGVVHHVTGDVAESVRWYAEAARRSAEGPRPAAGLDYGAVKVYAAATLRAAISRPPAEGARRWREVFLGGLDEHASRHFTVYAAGPDRARALGERADELFDRIARELLGRVPEARVELVVHPTREAYLAADPSPEGTPLADVVLPRDATAGVCYATLDAAGSPLVRVETHEQGAFEDDTLPHEIVHAVQRAGLPVFRRGHWLDEGLATLYESAAARQNRAALWRQLRAARIPLPELLALRSTPPDKAPLFYAEAHALASFLRGLGDEAAWRRFLGAYAEADFDSAVRDAYGVDSVADLERLWVESQ